jgi:hypothetical protein
MDTENISAEVSETTEPRIGKYKPKRKFINFITGLKGRVRLLNNVAFIKGEELSGMLEGAIFKITICDEDTIDFEELDTDLSTPEMIQRFIDDIDSRDVTGYTQKFVVSSLKFQDEDAKPCYLEVENEKPIDMLFSLFDKESSKEISEKGMSILDALFSSETDEELKREFEGESDEEIQLSMKGVQTILDSVETPPVPNEPLKKAAQSYMEESFRKMNEEKVIELKDRIEKTEKEILKFRMDVKQTESKITSSSDSLKILNTRLESLQPKDEPVGYDFFVSTENKTGIEPDENLVAVVEKIAPVLKLNTPVVIDMLTKGYYTIKIQKQGSDEEKEVEREIYKKIVSIDVMGKVDMISSTEFEYRGDMTWHQLIDKMIRMGFEQNPEFDKVSGSNSYESKEETKEAHVCGDGCSHDIDEKDSEIEDSFEEDNGYSIGEEFYFSIYHEPTASNSLGDPDSFISITPKSYWDNEGCQYDQHIDGLLRKKFPFINSLGDKFEEVQEGTFTISNFDGTNLMTSVHIGLTDTIEMMCKSGIKFNRDYQNFMSQKDLQSVIGIITQLGYQNIIC